jgi:hypothetical protein
MTYSINRLLSRFFSNPIKFRSLQADTATLISGPHAFQFFDRSQYSDDALELYTHPSHTRDVALWLVNDGYSFQPVSDSETSHFVLTQGNTWTPWSTPDNLDWTANTELDDEDLHTIHRFVGRLGGQERKIHIVAATHTPMESILASHSSASTTACLVFN